MLFSDQLLFIVLVNHDCDPTIVALIPNGDGIVAAHIPAFINGRQPTTGANDATSRITHRPYQRQCKTHIGTGHGRREGQCRPIIRHRHTRRTDRDDIVRSLSRFAPYNRQLRHAHSTLDPNNEVVTYF